MRSLSLSKRRAARVVRWGASLRQALGPWGRGSGEVTDAVAELVEAALRPFDRLWDRGGGGSGDVTDAVAELVEATLRPFDKLRGTWEREARACAARGWTPD
jgi:hypothetical protein